MGWPRDRGLCCNCTVLNGEARLARWAVDASRALAAGLLGACWAMAADMRIGWHPRLQDSGWYERVQRWDKLHTDEWECWLLDQSRPPGCRAPWEDAPKETP